MKNKKVKEQVPDNRWWLRVETNCYTEVTRQADPEKKWDGNDLAHSYSVEGWSAHKKDSYGSTFPMEGEVDKNKTYWLVYVTHSTGDSFHHETGCFEAVHVFEDANDADALARILEKDYEDKDKYDYKPLNVKLPSGKEIEIYTGTWKGYFERLESVHVEAIRYIK